MHNHITVIAQKIGSTENRHHYTIDDSYTAYVYALIIILRIGIGTRYTTNLSTDVHA